MPTLPANRFATSPKSPSPKSRPLGFAFDRQAAGSHEIWYNEHTDRYTTIPNHPGDMPEGTLRAILKQAGIEPDDSLKKK